MNDQSTDLPAAGTLSASPASETTWDDLGDVTWDDLGDLTWDDLGQDGSQLLERGGS